MKHNKKILVISFQSLTASSGAGMARLGYFLSAELHKRGLLKSFIVSSKGEFETPFPSSPVSGLSRYYLVLLQKISNLLHLKTYTFRYMQELFFDWFCTFKVTSDVTEIITTNPYLYRTFKKAKKYNIHISYIPGNCEDNFVCELVQEEQQKINLHFTDAYTYKKRLDFYNRSLKLADEIIATFPTSYETYAAAPNKNYKVISIEGYFKPELEPAEHKAADTGTFNVSYVAHTVLLKGLHYLLEAWENVMNDSGTEDMHLYIGGGIDISIADYLRTRFGNLKNVHFEGIITNVAAFLADKHMFVVPSLTEGSPISALEAAECGVPVILTKNCGVRNFFEGDSGWVIPIRDAEKIKEIILWAHSHKDEAKQIGLNAKTKVGNYKVEDLTNSLANYLEQL